MTAPVLEPVMAIGNAPTACHLFPLFGSAPFSHCGVPRAEQAFHRIPDPLKTAPICPVCGLPRCPICRRAQLEEDQR